MQSPDVVADAGGLVAVVDSWSSGVATFYHALHDAHREAGALEDRAVGCRRIARMAKVP